MSGPAEESTEATLPGARTAYDSLVPTRLVRGTNLGRYVVLAQIGAGAMGTVYAAYDPKLDRKVAVKLLHPSRTGERARLRLQREAQALARLSHPNVVGVHDVGELGGQVFVAMEFVQGHTLRQWLGQPRSWPEIVEVFEAAAEGLAAAHAVDLVHRDFKPDNVMIGADGRVRVMDFGLARASSDTSNDSLGDEDEVVGSPDAVALTQTGALLGTPGYMAPEQFAGRTGTVKSDQFAFCVALYEALLGVRPFRGASPEALARAVLAGERSNISATSSAPAWLHGLVDRGLATAPEDRFESMEALRDALGRGKSRPGRRRRIAAIGLGVVGAGALAMLPGWLDARATAACTELGSSIEAVWGEPARASVTEALGERGGPLGADTAQRVIPRLDAAAQAWREQQTNACVETTVHDRWSGETRARAAWCLDRHRLELAAVVDQIVLAPQGRSNNAVTAASALEQQPSCTDLDSLGRSPAPPSLETLPSYVALMKERRGLAALYESGDFGAGLDAAKRIRRQAARRGWNELAADTEMTEGYMLRELGELQTAEARLSASYVRAAKADAWPVAAEAASQLGHLVGSQPGRLAEGRAWLRDAEVAGHHAGDPLELLRASRLHAAALLDAAAGDREQGLHRLEQAARLREAALGSDHPLVGETIAALGASRFYLKHYERATADLERAVQLLSRAFGPDHPRLVSPLNNLAPLASIRGDLDAAQRYLRRALRIVETNLGADAPMAGMLHQNLGTVAERRGDLASAAISYRRAVEIIERVDGADGRGVVPARRSLASALVGNGKPAAARTELERAIRTCQRRGCPAMDDAAARFALAKLLDPQADGQEARALGRLARVRFEEAGAAEEEDAVARWLAEHWPEPQ